MVQVELAVSTQLSIPAPQSTVQELLEKKYRHVGRPSEGLIRVQREDGRWLHVKEEDGSPAYSQTFVAVGDFEDGEAYARERDEWIYIHPDGTKVEN